MSLSFKTVNLLASAASILTKEQIDAVLYPVTIVLTEEVVLAEDTGPVFESTGSAETSNDSGTPPVIIPPVTIDTAYDEGPWGEITVGELMAEIIRDFKEGTYANPEVGGGKLALEVQSGGLGGDDTGGNQEVPNDNTRAF